MKNLDTLDCSRSQSSSSRHAMGHFITVNINCLSGEATVFDALESIQGYYGYKSQYFNADLLVHAFEIIMNAVNLLTGRPTKTLRLHKAPLNQFQGTLNCGKFSHSRLKSIYLHQDRYLFCIWNFSSINVTQIRLASSNLHQKTSSNFA